MSEMLAAIPNLWAYSALVNGILAMAAVYLGLRLTHGAGFNCPQALLLYFHRIAFMLLALALLNCGLHVIQVRQAPPVYAMLTQLAFLAVLLLSAARHALAPSIPPGASWRRPMHTISFVGALIRPEDSR